MEDLGPPVAYLALPEGVPVYSSDGERIGTVEHVLAAEDADIFDGLVIDTADGHRFADAPEIAELHERGAVLAIDAAGARELPEPSENPGVLDFDPADAEEEGRLGGKLRRAWDLISGNY
jgi:hypothetical protein